MFRSDIERSEIREWWRSHRLFHAAFQRATACPRKTQAEILSRILRANSESAYGRRYNFGQIRSIRQFQDTVPITGYDDLVPWIEAIKDGEPRVLTAEPVLFLERTSGTSSAIKYIPYTRAFLREYRRAIGAWMGDLCRQRPAIMKGRSYWAISPIAQPPEVTRGGLRAGVPGDASYFDEREQSQVRSLLAAPNELGAVRDVEAHRYSTLRFLVEAADLAWISVWNPSFLTLLVRGLEAWSGRLIDDLRRGTLTPPAPLDPETGLALARRFLPQPRRAEALARGLNGARSLDPRRLWPSLALISCWTSAEAARSLPELQNLFPGVEIQGKGLMATEGAVSVPLAGLPGGVVSLTSHFYEFLQENAENAAQPRLADELETGRSYTVLLTTGAGLYRYRLEDTVRVIGRIRAAPVVEFIGRTAGIADLRGEKLNEAFVRGALDEALAAFAITPEFAMLAPEWAEPPFYALFLEAAGVTDEVAGRLAECVEQKLAAQYHYGYCRRLNQLGAVRVFRIRRNAKADYLRACQALGQRIGVAKPVSLHRQTDWTARFEGAFVAGNGGGPAGACAAEEQHAGAL